MNKIIAVGSDSENNVCQRFKDLMPNIIHLLRDMHMNDNIKEKALKLGFTKSEVGTLIKNIFGKQIENTVEKGLADSLTIECLKTKMEKHSAKGGAVLSIF